MVRLTDKKLTHLRRRHRDAGALVVAASVEHAYQIADILRKETGDEACIATYVHDDAQDVISTFRETQDKWVVSVGMISEGTDIPRLRVCCHLTRVKTELYFRQVLGRILRSTGVLAEEGYLFMPAEPNLMEFAQRVAENIPEANAIVLDKMVGTPVVRWPLTEQSEPRRVEADSSIELGSLTVKPHGFTGDLNRKSLRYSAPASALSEAYDAAVGLFGRFREHILSQKT